MTDYPQLRSVLQQEGLFDRQPRFYIFQGFVILAGFLLSLGLLFLTETFLAKLLGAVSLSFVFTHTGSLIHDAGHCQIMCTRRANDVLMLCLGFVVGISRSWWVVNHNRHHGATNDLALDPHLAIPVLAFSSEQVETRKGLRRALIKFQPYYFFPLLGLEALNVRYASIKTILAGRAKYPIWEGAALVSHALWYVILLTSVMTVSEVILFALLHQGLTGLYMGLVFAPNHKGMPLYRGEHVSFLTRQIMSSRNIRPGFWTDWLSGGANYQIEHHLFPTVPRCRLRQVRDIVKRYCYEKDLPYTETGWSAAYGEIWKHLRDVVDPARNKDTSRSHLRRWY